MPDYEDQRTEKKKKKKKNRDLYLSGSSDVVCTCGTYCGKGIYSPECSCGRKQSLSADQIKNMVLDDDYSWNSLYVDLKYRFVDVGEVPGFVDTMEISAG